MMTNNYKENRSITNAEILTMISLEEAARRTRIPYMTLRDFCLSESIAHFIYLDRIYVDYDILIRYIKTFNFFDKALRSSISMRSANQIDHPSHEHDSTPGSLTSSESDVITHTPFSTPRYMCSSKQIARSRPSSKFYVDYNRLVNHLRANDIK